MSSVHALPSAHGRAIYAASPLCTAHPARRGWIHRLAAVSYPVELVFRLHPSPPPPPPCVHAAEGRGRHQRIHFGCTPQGTPEPCGSSSGYVHLLTTDNSLPDIGSCSSRPPGSVATSLAPSCSKRRCTSRQRTVTSTNPKPCIIPIGVPHQGEGRQRASTRNRTHALSFSTGFSRRSPRVPMMHQH